MPVLTQHGSTDNPANSRSATFPALLTHGAPVAGTLHRGLPLEHEVFRPYQFSHGRFFFGMVQANPADRAGAEVSGGNSGNAASRHRNNPILPFDSVSISFRCA